MSDSRTIRVDEFLAHPPARVWKALTGPVLLAKWLMPNDFRPVAGHRFTFLTDPRPNASTVMTAFRAVLAARADRYQRQVSRPCHETCGRVSAPTWWAADPHYG